MVHRMPETEAIEPELDPYSRLVAQSVERISPAVAGIEARSASGRARGTGSGVVYTPDGYLLTNSHVAQHADTAVVSLSDGRTRAGRREWATTPPRISRFCDSTAAAFHTLRSAAR